VSICENGTTFEITVPAADCEPTAKITLPVHHIPTSVCGVAGFLFTAVSSSLS
jgi:hypothetical protein